jgi:hypothetical protein
MSVRVTQIHFDVAGSLGGSGVLVTNEFLAAVYTDKTEGVRVTQEQVAIAYSDKTNGVQVTNLFLVFAAGYPEIAMDSAPFESAEIFSFTADSSFPGVTTPSSQIEPNPYAPIIDNGTVNDLPASVAGVLGPQQEMLRKQHNLTQAGDTTFPWDLIQDTTTDQAYNLGSEGTFFTPYGICRAVYVQFSGLNSTLSYGTMPYGRLKNTSLVDWKVTNDVSQSDVDWCVGIAMLADLPTEGSYGWLVTSGPNISQLLCLTQGTPAIDDTYVWLRTGAIGRNVAGRIIARQWGTTGQLTPGNVFIRLEGPNDALLSSLFDSDFTAIENAIAQLQSAIQSLQNANPSGLADRVTTAEQALVLLQKALSDESATRSKVDQQLQDAINNGLVTVEQFNEYKTQLNTSLTAQFNQITTRLNADEKTIAASKLVTDQIDPKALSVRLDKIESNIALLLQLIGNIPSSTAVLPLTIGLPPQFFYFDDGNYMFTEIE